MLYQTAIIKAFVRLAAKIDRTNDALSFAVNRTFIENNWLTKENYWHALYHWKNALTNEKISAFVVKYPSTNDAKNVGIIMAGNIPSVGFHDLLCVLLSGHRAVIKPSSEDKYVITVLITWLQELEPQLLDKIKIVERVNLIDAVIATGSNNSFRYFEAYFKEIPRLLRKNRKSLAVLDGSESNEDLSNLADDVFQYFGLGCRNVSFIFLPRTMPITVVLDAFMKYKDLANHNKYANNYTYHRALLLMNTEQHLDTGFVLPKERKNLHAPLACIHYYYYNDIQEVSRFIEENKRDIQCVVGNYSIGTTIPFGQSQKPDLQDFADNENTLQFLMTINNNS